MEDYKVIYQKRERDNDIIDKALDVVRRFIIEKGLILYGGLAIDYALRLKGSQIYPDDERPDYDFFSTDNVADAYELADRLKDFKNVSAIRRLHVQTMGVRIDFADVADISNMPRDLFDQLPVIEYGGMKILHPFHQRMDMHLSFSFPFLGAPREVVYHRFAKDLKRYNLIAEYWGSGESIHDSTTDEPMDESDVKTSVDALREFTLPEGVQYAIHGLAAFELVKRAFAEMKETSGGDATKGEKSPSVFIQDSKISYQAREPELVLATPEPLALVEKLVEITGSKPQWFAPYLDAAPTTCRVGDYLVYSLRFRDLAITQLRKNEPPIVCTQYLMLYLLHKGYNDLYGELLVILNEASDRLAKVGNEYGLTPEFAKIVNTSPFGLTTRVFSSDNPQLRAYDPAVQINVAQISERNGLPLPTGFPPATDLPKNYYPGRGKAPEAVYNPLYFRRSGEKVNSVDDVIL